MNILVINYEYPPLGGGGGIASKIMAEELSKLGHKVIVLTSRIKGLKKTEVENGVKIYRVPVIGRKNKSEASNISLFSWPFTSIPKAVSLCRKYKIDLINTHFYAPTGPTGMVTSLLLNVPNIIYTHGTDVYNSSKINKTPSGKGFLSWLLKLSLNLQTKIADAVVCQTEFMKKRTQSLIKDLKSKAKVTVIPLPFKVPQVDILQRKKSDGFKLVTIGRLVKSKGFSVLLKALTYLPEQIKIDIIGDGSEKEGLRKMCRDLKIKHRVNFLGYIDPRDEKRKYEILCEADCFVLASSYETFGIVFQEAMYCGLPIVTTKTDGARSILEQPKNALFAKVNDAEDLASKILKIYNKKTLRDKMSRNNLQTIQKYYPESIIKEEEQFFLQILDK
ncbi:glycosyltransferase [Candidatus Dojkabacteria bacterium]|nr:glycosyltransferase [Candidatus Dojkabacteria bacterium]